MEEKYLILALSLLMIIIALIAGYLASTGFGISSSFNFYSSQLLLNGKNVTETLHFNPDMSYHTLFRTFSSPIGSGNNSVSISSVMCSAGTPYYKTELGICNTFQNGSVTNACLPNTENNEYGCTFGDVLGFSQGTDYSMTANYTLNPANLFLINGKYYIKFVAYSANDHVDLKSGVNFFANGAVAASEYLPSQDVVLYIPYNGSLAGFNIVDQSGFGFAPQGVNYSIFFFNFFVFLIPLILFDGIWLFLARQKKEPAPPSQLSDMPNNRKPWEVSVYFNPPLMMMDKNFYATLMMDFYRRKIIDIKYVDAGMLNKKTFVKINSTPTDLDDIEKAYLQYLTDLGTTVKPQDHDGDYFNIVKANPLLDQGRFMAESLAMQKAIMTEGKQFVDTKARGIFFVLAFALVFVGALTSTFSLFISAFISMFIMAIVQTRTTLLMKYRDDFYEEYRQWMSFKHGLSFLSSVKDAGADAVVQWETYLVYATALGVADKVLAQLKGMNMIDADRLTGYSGAYIGARAFSVSSAGGGGHGGGAGGGGVGGGGGGGR